GYHQSAVGHLSPFIHECRTYYLNSRIYLDLHGMNQQQAKQELAALLTLCRRENIHVASVMHGIGKHILKQRIPSWLAQHPNVQAFHQAPREWGGESAILVLLDIEE
ncbi:endonuclease SmrB, partial [Aeromonas taiwanensis]